MASDKAEVLYFAYGSNLSSTQMRRRCPKSEPVALTHLPGWKWFISGRGYVNIKPVMGTTVEGVTHCFDPSVGAGPGVYGILYRLDPADEEMLDDFEGVPFAYEKSYLEVDKIEADKIEAENAASGEKVEVLVYIDAMHVHKSRPRREYVARMNRAINEAVEQWGLPKAYVDEVMRPFIRAP